MALPKTKLDALQKQYEDALTELEHHKALLDPEDPMVTQFRLEAEVSRWEAVVSSLKTVLDTVTPRKGQGETDA